MTTEKQIEEMAKGINLADHEHCDGRCIGCEYKAMVTEGFICVDVAIATGLFAKDYRKASEVAREILTDRTLIDHLERACGAGGKLALARINELKKEYEVTQC